MISRYHTTILSYLTISCKTKVKAGEEAIAIWTSQSLRLCLFDATRCGAKWRVEVAAVRCGAIAVLVASVWSRSEVVRPKFYHVSTRSAYHAWLRWPAQRCNTLPRYRRIEIMARPSLWSWSRLDTLTLSVTGPLLAYTSTGRNLEITNYSAKINC